MRMLFPGLLVLGALPLFAVKPCTQATAYAPCDIVLEVSAGSMAKVKNPWRELQVTGEFRAPDYKTFRVEGFWDGGNKVVLRLGPNQAGQWTYRLTSNVVEFHEKIDKLTVAAAAPETVTWIRRANAHHWQHTEELKPHLYMGADEWLGVETLAAAKFTHGTVEAWPAGELTDVMWWQKLDARVQALNEKGLVADLVMAPSAAEWQKRLPAWGDRSAYLQYLVARYAAFNVVWQVAGEWESGPNTRPLMRELGLLLKKADPYEHPRGSGAAVTSSGLGGDQWMDYVNYGAQAPGAVTAIEHVLNTVPQVARLDGTLAPDAFRKRLWNLTMSGAYPVVTGKASAENLKVMTGWFEVMSRVRFWDVEPWFDLDGGRGLAGPDTEYLVYVENPMKVEVSVVRHGYDVYWINPTTGEARKEKKDWKGDLFEGTPPDATRDWILHLSRDGRKEGMAKSYKFESWPIAVQEPERSPQKATFELAAPAQEVVLKVGEAVPFEVKLRKKTAGTRRMTYMLVGEIVRDGQGNRVLATGDKGTLTVPANLLAQSDGVINVRLAALNAPGKAYLIDYIFSVKK